MRDTIIKTGLREAVFRSFSLVARMLPLWKETDAVEVLPPMQYLPVALPVNYEKLPEDFAKQFVKIKSIPRRRIFILKDVCVSGRAVVFRNLRIFTPSLPWLRDIPHYRKGRLLSKQWLRNVKVIPDSTVVALVYDNWSAENYYHWMVESLPRLLMVQESFPDSLLLIPEPAPEYIRNTVALLGFNKVLPFSRRDDNILKVSTLVSPELVYYDEEEYGSLSGFRSQRAFAPEIKASSHQSTPLPKFGEEELIVTVRKKLLLKFYDKPAVPERRVFVSRSRQKTRRLVNENDVLPVLERYGFEIVYFEALTFKEQVNLMLQTAVFVSVHGSNIVNILFLPFGAQVVEMMNKELLNDAYYLMSSSIGLPYYSVPCTMADTTLKGVDDTVAVNDAGLLVNISELEDTLCLALKQSVNFNSST